MRIVFWLTASPPALFPVSGDALCFWRRLKNPLLSSAGRWRRAGLPAEPLRLRHHVGEFVLFFHLTPLLSSSASPSLLPVCRNRYKLSGVWWCRKPPEYQNYQGWVGFYGLLNSCSAAASVCVHVGILVKWKEETFKPDGPKLSAWSVNKLNTTLCRK